MASLMEVMEQSRLIVLTADSDAAAIAYTEQTLESAGHPLWTWDDAHGLQPLADGAPAGRTPTPGAHAGHAARAITAFQNLDAEAVLLVLGADGLKATDALKVALRSQMLLETLRIWVVLASEGADLSDLLERIDQAPAEFSVDIRPAAPRSTTPSASVDKTPLQLRDIENLDAFDTPDWTERLNDLPIDTLKTICDDQLYEECVARIELLCSGLKEIFVGKDSLIDLAAWCSVAHLPMLLLGTWGTGKSMIVRQFSQGLGISPHERRIHGEDELIRRLAVQASRRGGGGTETRTGAPDVIFEEDAGRHFEYLVTRFTTPEELLGPVNIDVMLSHAIHLRQTRALMPRAEIVFLDEVFKANSSILNALLSIINERLFYNAGVPWTVNMVMLFAASNEPPQEEDLGAFYDRFPVRCMCNPVPNEMLSELLDRAHSQHFMSLMPKSAPARAVKTLDPHDKLSKRRMKRCACVNDLRLLRKVCLYKFGGLDSAGDDSASRAFHDTYIKLFRELREVYDVSDRSCGHFYRLARARALLKRREGLLPEDCRVLYYCAKNPEAAAQLPSTVDSLIG
jgi:MoxR-like ATPase